MDMNEILKNAQKLQKEMQRHQEKMVTKEAEGSAGGEMVRVRINGKLEVQKLFIDPQLLKDGDQAMLEDLIVSAVNQAIVKIQEETQKGYGNLMGQAGLPPGFPGL